MLDTTTAIANHSPNPTIKASLSANKEHLKKIKSETKNSRNTQLSFKFTEESEEKLSNFFAEFSFQVVFFERVNSFTLS